MGKTTLYIDFEKIDYNIRYMSKGMECYLVVKANSYGAGQVSIIELIKRGYKYFAVSTLEEAYVLRKLNKKIEILLLSPIENEEITNAFDKNIDVTIISFEQLKLIDDFTKVQFKFDTGMGRIGFSMDDIYKLKKLLGNKHIKGIYSHLAAAGSDEKSNIQIGSFKKIVEIFKDNNVEKIHLQNSLGSIKYDLDFVNMKRLGIGMWGYLADKEEYEKYGLKLQQTMSLYANVIQNKYYKGYIGYDHSDYVDGKIATLRIGYHDFLPRKLHGFEFNDGSKIVGKICMCQTMLLVENPIEEKEIFGPKESIYDLAMYTDTIVHEFIARLSCRVERKNVEIGEKNE
ncbi:MAG: alanine racemase [Mycoplasmatales bacterium]